MIIYTDTSIKLKKVIIENFCLLLAKKKTSGKKIRFLVGSTLSSKLSIDVGNVDKCYLFGVL